LAGSDKEHIDMKIVTIKEVSARLGIPEATLRYWRFLGSQGPKSFTLGRRVVYAEEDVEAWIQAQYDAADKQPA
jgi:predicted DNA-binding transcriptional regulator AlpA